MTAQVNVSIPLNGCRNHVNNDLLLINSANNTRIHGDVSRQFPHLLVPTSACKPHRYHYDVSNPFLGMDDPRWAKGFRCGTNVDTEFKEYPATDIIDTAQVRNRHGVTGQMSGILDGPARIFVHPDQAEYAVKIEKPLRHPVMRHEWLFIDYLETLGYPIAFRRCTNTTYTDNLSPACIDHFAFFALAESCMIFTGQCKQDVLQLFVEGAITQNRRLATRDIIRCDDWLLDYCPMPWIIILGGYEYAVRLRWIDAAGIHGVASYRDLLINTGQDVDDKDLMHETALKNNLPEFALIENMHNTYFDFPDEFNRYALGDLHVYEALTANITNFEAIYKTLGLEPYVTAPYLTIGKTIAQMVESAILKLFGYVPTLGKRGKQTDIEDAPYENDILPALMTRNRRERDSDFLISKPSILRAACYYASAQYFRKQTQTTAAFLAKVFGGMCRTHRVSLVRFIGMLLDLDLSGCYAQGLRAQDLPFGRPVVMAYSADSHINVYPTLAQFLAQRHYFISDNQLVPGLWMACVTLSDDHWLEYPQTFFPSWYAFSRDKDTGIPGRNVNIKPVDDRIVDLQNPSIEMIVDSGNTKILHHTIKHAMLTQDGLEWILHACSSAQRDELLHNLRVVSAAYYKNSDRVDTVEELCEALRNHRGRNTWEEYEQDALTTTESKQQECHKWTSVNFGTLLVDQLLANRQLYPKKISEEKPYPHSLNTLFKLIPNGLFGIMTSPHFLVGNTIVGNAITARARAACWYMMATFNGVQSITDGVQLDLNAVPIARQHERWHNRLTPQKILPLRYEHNLDHATEIDLKAIAGYDRFTQTYEDGVKVLYAYRRNTVRRLPGKAMESWLNKVLMKAMQRAWPNKKISVLHAPSTSIVVANAGSCEGPPIITYRNRIGQFEFEMKELYHSGAFHSSANHLLLGGKEPVAKHRSYNKKIRYHAYELIHDMLIPQNYYDTLNPPRIYLESVLANPHAVPRGYAYVHKKLIKANEFNKRYKSFFSHTILEPGGSYTACGLFKEFSLTQCTTNSVEQFRTLEAEYERSKEQHGQYVECFFVNSDGTLDVVRMMDTCQRLIDKDCMSLLQALDPHDHFTARGGNRTHPQFAALQALRHRLTDIYGGYLSEDVDPDDMYDADDMYDEVA